MPFKQLLQPSNLRLMLFAILLLGLTVVGNSASSEAKAQSPIMVVDNPSLGDTPHAETTCTSFDIYVGEQNEGAGYTIGCTPGSNGVNFFAPQFPESKKANRILATALAAKGAGKTITVIYVSNDAGCGEGCRWINTLRIDH
ncbi:MAG: hypothetical protein U0175_27930 [Caldilineaceae bacterium]